MRPNLSKQTETGHFWERGCVGEQNVLPVSWWKLAVIWKNGKVCFFKMSFFRMLSAFNNVLWSQPSGSVGMPSVGVCKSHPAFLNDYWSCMESFPLSCQRDACHCLCPSSIHTTQGIYPYKSGNFTLNEAESSISGCTSWTAPIALVLTDLGTWPNRFIPVILKKDKKIHRNSLRRLLT